jgi:protein-S-isoprenylcysteine O-methyltransferase Ste14
MKKLFYFSYAILCYLIFFITFLYLIGFVTNLLVPKSINTGEESPLPITLLINIGLLTLFGIQHSVMARKDFKKTWTKIVPEPIERSTYVLFASMAVILLLFFWKPIPYTFWNFSGTPAGYILIGISFLGWVVSLVSTFLINHFHLFGLHQVYHFKANKDQKMLKFRTPFLYKIVRHPLYLGFLIAFWFTPVMTGGHFLFALGMTIYIAIGIYHEEKDLVSVYGESYEAYRKNTPMILPFTRNSDDSPSHLVAK